MPGIGWLTAITYRTRIDDPARLRSSADVVAYLGLTSSRYQSRTVDRGGGITKCGDAITRAMLFEAARPLLTRAMSTFALPRCGRQLATRTGHRKARVAVVRKLDVLPFCRWRYGSVFAEVSAA